MTTQNDTFSGEADNTSLVSHTPDSGGSWTVHPSTSSYVTYVMAAGYIRSQYGNETFHYHSATPASADYTVQATCHAASGTYVGGPCGRIDTSVDTRYGVYYDGGPALWILYKYVSGTYTQIDSYSGDAPTTARNVELIMSGTSLTVKIDGVTRISNTDSSITAAGKAGVMVLATTEEIQDWSFTDMSISGVSPTTFAENENPLTISGSGFNATQGTGTVYISPFNTLAGSVHEVDVSSAVSSWSDTSIALNLNSLSAAIKTELDNLGPSANQLGTTYASASSQYLSRSSALTGAADGNLITFAFQIKKTSTGSNQFVFDMEDGGSGSCLVEFDGSGHLFVFVTTSGGSYTFYGLSSDTFADTSDYYSIIISGSGVAGALEAYVNDVQVNWSSHTVNNNSGVLTGSSMSIGAAAGGGTYLNASIRRFWYNDEYLDLTSSTNRRKFFDANNNPTDWGSDGSTPTGSQPLIYMEDGGFADYTNLGSGGAFTKNNSPASYNWFQSRYVIVLTSTPNEDGSSALTMTAASAGTTIDATSVSMTLTGHAATISTNVKAASASMTLATHAATISSNLNANVAALTLTPYTATVTLPATINVAVSALTLTTYQATISAGVNTNINAGVHALTLATQVANVNAANNISGNIDSLILTAYGATVVLSNTVNAGVSALTLTAYPVTIGRNIAASIVNNTLTTYAALVGVGVEIAVGTSGFALAAYQATLTHPVDLNAGYGALTLSPYSCTVSYRSLIWGEEAGLSSGWSEEANTSKAYSSESPASGSWT